MSMNFDRNKIQTWIKVDDDIRKGSFGQVYTGYSKKLDSLVAVKMIRPVGDYERQITILTALSSLTHPNIMGYYGSKTQQSRIYIYIQYCPNGTLQDALIKGLTELEVLRLFRQLIEGMCYINAKGKMHRDLKPQNVLMGIENDVKISDFGLAQSTNSIFVTGKLGTPLYAAPQVFLIDTNQAQSYTNKCDVWGAGMLLYEMLTGQKLFGCVQTYQDLKQEWLKYQRGIKRAQLPEKFHPLWEYFINWMLNFDPKRRPTFHEVLQNLKKVYDRMKSQLQTQGGMQKSPDLHRVDNFVQYQIQKYNILLQLCDTFTKEDIRICNEYKYSLMFLSIIRFLSFSKKFIRDLRYRRIKQNEVDIIDNFDDIEIQMFIDKERFIIEHRIEFYNEQLKTTFVNKILSYYAVRESSKAIMMELGDVVKMAKEVQAATFIFNEEACQDGGEAMKEMLASIQKRHKDVTTYFTIQQLRIYNLMLLAMLLDQTFPIDKFMDKGSIKQRLNKVATSSKEDIIQEIKALREKCY